MSRLPCSSSSARGLFLNVLLAAAIPAPLLPTRPLRVLPSLLPKSPNLPDAKMTISFHSPCARAMLWLRLKWEDASSPPPPPRWHSEPGECKQYCIRPRTQSLKTQLLGFSSSSRSDLPLSLVHSLPTFHHHHTSQKMASSLLQPKIVTLMQINSKKPAACCLF